MGKLPAISGRGLVKVLDRLGWEYDHHEGSHMILRRREPPHRRLTVPDHKTLKKKTLKTILNVAGLDVDTLLDNL